MDTYTHIMLVIINVGLLALEQKKRPLKDLIINYIETDTHLSIRE